MSEQRTIRLIVTRQDDPDSRPYQEEFRIPYRQNMNVISAFMEIQRNPVNAAGEKVRPIQWESNCLEEVCGACSMVINGRPRQACSALIDKLEQPIRISPMNTFPVIRDLIVDRGRMFDALKRVKAWIPIDGSHDLGPGPRQSQEESDWRYELSKCMTCGVCLQACPNVNNSSDFMGPFIVGQVNLFNAHPTGALNKDERTSALIGEGGLQECGNSQNCVQACPKGIPLTTSIAIMNRESTRFVLKKWLSF
ncbi:succinate dehydrogenase subunit B [Seinonella peptonophila]|uniref:succinate dehydrogenase n=1 Tax=Seinonella peptonophila TaxID=112248 RepID=A0A1M4U4Q4_9BACL|nr:succinate dehydrogenase iron-sulfur subunit [Seinonella peptonophila]SHE51616.1 succinate dehydrogenase subunit B [Seinonella peptonophila]